MSSYVTITLDTTKPVLTIIAPPYTSGATVTHIVVQANEELAAYQDIYIIDSTGFRQDLVMSLSPDKTSYSGNFILSGLATGIATIYASLKDEVEHLSLLTTKTMTISATVLLIADVYDQNIYDIQLSSTENKISVADQNLFNIEITTEGDKQ